MRLRKLAGFTASALVASAISIPALAGSAQAAPTSASVAVNQDCTIKYNTFTMVTEYNTSLAISADGTGVTVPASAAGVLYDAGSGATFPTFKMESITSTVKATVNGEAVTLAGTTTRAGGAGVSLGEPLALPALTGTRVQTAPVTQATVTSVAFSGTLRVPYGPPGGSSASVAFTCEGAQDADIKQALKCTFGEFSFVYPAEIKARTSPKHARVAMVTDFVSGMPAFVPVSKIVDNMNLNVAGTALVAKGVTSYDPPAAGDTKFKLPVAFANRGGVSDVATSDVKVTGATLVMTSGGDDSTVDCVPTAWPASQPCIDSNVALSNAEVAVKNANAAAAAAVAGLQAANSKVASANKAATKANKAAKKAASKLSKAKKAVKKAKSKKAKAKAKKAYSKAKKANTKAKKALTKAKAQVKSSKAAAAAAANGASASNANAAAAAARVTAAKAEVAKNC